MHENVEYTEGYLAFLDILGFSNYICEEHNDDKKEYSKNSTKEIIDIFMKVQRISEESMGVKMAFFSDSVVLTTDNYEKFLYPISILEHELLKKTGLLYRGAIVKGEYYHHDNIAFGPALIEAHNIEKEAMFSRIVISDSIDVAVGIDYFKDIDGKNCINPYGKRILFEFPCSENEQKNMNRQQRFKCLLDGMLNISNDIKNNIISVQGNNKSMNVCSKYVWRAVPFNFLCDYIIQNPSEMNLINIDKFTNEEIEEINECKVKIQDLVVGYGYIYRELHMENELYKYLILFSKNRIWNQKNLEKHCDKNTINILLENGYIKQIGVDDLSIAKYMITDKGRGLL